MHVAKQKKFLFLQGPHGPFFHELSKIIFASGAQIKKIGFNVGDEFFWKDKSTYVGFHQPLEEWDAFIEAEFQTGTTDLVVYGAARPVHRVAIAAAKKLGIKVHFFEEGYLRPFWITYERDGVNGNSRLMETSIEEMRYALSRIDEEQPEAPARWGELRSHMFYGARYHFRLMFFNKRYSQYTRHREATLRQESWSHIKRAFSLPFRAVQRVFATQKLRNNGYVYHLALLQLGHDASIQDHSGYTSMPEFMRDVVFAFAKGAPKHHHLVFKAHPLEDYRIRLDRLAVELAKEFGIEDRIHFLDGGKLAKILDFARSVVSVNSTAAQQALWRGLPVKAMGQSVYSKPELASSQPLHKFFALPHTPDLNAYRDYRRYLLVTSQITGGFYSRKSRARLIRQVVDMVLSEDDPYDLISHSRGAPMQQIKLIN